MTASERLMEIRRELDEIAQHVDSLATALERPNEVRLVGQSEAAEILGWKTTKVVDERRAGRFPEPYVQLRCGPIWLADQVEALRGEA